MSLLTPHLLWKTAGHSPTRVAMATIQALFLSGRYRCGSLIRHWAPCIDNGFCHLSPACTEIIEDISHIQGVFLAMGVWAFPTGNLKGRQEILDYFGQLVEIKQLVLFLET